MATKEKTNKCNICNTSVGNEVFTVCDDCWNKNDDGFYVNRRVYDKAIRSQLYILKSRVRATLQLKKELFENQYARVVVNEIAEALDIKL